VDPDESDRKITDPKETSASLKQKVRDIYDQWLDTIKPTYDESFRSLNPFGGPYTVEARRKRYLLKCELRGLGLPDPRVLYAIGSIKMTGNRATWDPSQLSSDFTQESIPDDTTIPPFGEKLPRDGFQA
jgi:hypothetical protein